jgi:hypothetical protein
VTARWIVQTALQVAEDDIGRAKLVANARERDRRVIDVHQVDVAGEDHVGHAATLVVRHCVANPHPPSAN